VLDSDSVAFENHAPDIRAGTASPSGGETVRYESPTLSVDVGDREFATTQGDNVTVEFYVDGSAVGTTTLTSNGTASLSPPALADGAHTWSAVATDDYGGQTTSQTFSFVVEHDAPVLSDPGPSGDQNSEPGQLSVDLADADFPRDGDSVDVAFALDGSAVGTTTLTSNGTASLSMPARGQAGGNHSLTVTATDDYGYSASADAEYRVPATLSVYNETAPTDLVNDSTVRVRFFDAGTVVERSTTDGTINLTGLPVDSGMTVVAQADGYKTRASYIPSLYAQQRVYLLAENVSTANLVYQLNDQTGNFPAEETFISIEKPISRDRDGDGSNETAYESIAGDKFGAASEFAADLVSAGERYRIVVTNIDGDRRELGAYTVTDDDAVPLTIGQVTFSSSESGSVATGASLVDHNGSRYIRVRYADGARETDRLNLSVIRQDGTELTNRSLTGPFGRFAATIAVPASAPDDVTYRVEWAATRDEETVRATSTVGDVPEIATTIGLDPTVLAYASYVLIAALTGLVVVFDDRLAALVGTVTATALSLVGAVSIPPLALAMAGVISVIANVGRVR
jgi:hypothetical protein